MEPGDYSTTVNIKTWGDFKKAVKNLGLKNEDEINLIDWKTTSNGLTIIVGLQNKIWITN